MICLLCDGEKFTRGDGVVGQHFRGEHLEVKTSVTICDACGFATVGNDQLDDLLKNTKAAYEKRMKETIAVEKQNLTNPNQRNKMSEEEIAKQAKQNGERPAFPHVADEDKQEHLTVEWGLTKRELFAAMAMQGLLMNHSIWDEDAATIAKWATEQSDALLDQLERTK